MDLSNNDPTYMNRISSTPLSIAFFSNINKEYLHNQIIHSVYEKSQGKYKISKQSDEELFLVMHKVFIDHRQLNFETIETQIKKLNQNVLDLVVPSIMCSIESYLYYRKDIGEMHTPLQLPKYSNEKEKGYNVDRFYDNI